MYVYNYEIIIFNIFSMFLLLSKVIYIYNKKNSLGFVIVLIAYMDQLLYMNLS